jgi:hypothetical protein
MTDPTPVPQIIADPAAAPSDGDVGELSEHHEHAIINRRLDEDLV